MTKKTKKDQLPCFIFDYKKRKQYLITNGKRRLIKKLDLHYRQWPDYKPQQPGQPEKRK